MYKAQYGLLLPSLKASKVATMLSLFCVAVCVHVCLNVHAHVFTVTKHW